LVDKIPLGEIYERTQFRRVHIVARSLKYKHAGHTIRDNTNKWNTILTPCIPHWGKRSRGRPCTRWADEINKNLGPIGQKRQKTVKSGRVWLRCMPRNRGSKVLPPRTHPTCLTGSPPRAPLLPSGPYGNVNFVILAH